MLADANHEAHTGVAPGTAVPGLVIDLSNGRAEFAGPQGTGANAEFGEAGTTN